MAPLDLHGDTLGRKHASYNKMLSNAVVDDQNKDLKTFAKENYDLDNIKKIDIACQQRNVEYILSVLKSDDMLCITKVLNQSVWLITEDQYADIINPKYLNDNLLPAMMAKAWTKLMKHIRLHINNEVRAEEFYRYETDKVKAVKWLLHCSAPFIKENFIKFPPYMELGLFKRLCKKSKEILNTAVDMSPHGRSNTLQVAMFLLKDDVNKFLDIVEKGPRWSYPDFDKKYTQLIMQQAPERIINNFGKYINSIHIPTFVKYIKIDIKDFILDIVQKENTNNCNYDDFYNFNVLKHFIWMLPDVDRFDFVRKVFIDGIPSDCSLERSANAELCAMKQLSNQCQRRTEPFYWYEFATFKIALKEIRTLIENKKNECNKYTMLFKLVEWTKRDINNIQDLLKYYKTSFKNDSVDSKYSFLGNLLSEINMLAFNEQLWPKINEIFIEIGLYTDFKTANDKCLDTIIIKSILSDSNELDNNILDNKDPFSSLTVYKKFLSDQQRKKLFNIVYEYLVNKLNKITITKEREFTEARGVLQNIMNLLKDWDKELTEYCFVQNKIRELIQIKTENTWKTSLSCLYNVNKKWRKEMFEESINLNPSEEVCLNALKHDPALLARYQSEVDVLCCDDNVSLRRLINKLRIYWPTSLADTWAKNYLSKFDKLSTGFKAVTKGACMILPQQILNEIITKYAPQEAKIDWKDTDDKLNIQRYIAHNMHLARPQPSPEAILMYAKGDYIQFCMPSIFSIYYNLKREDSKKYISLLLDAPVSLQKHGIRFAFRKLNSEEIKIILSSTWNRTNNVSIRAVVFKFTYTLLCHSGDDNAKAESVWKLLEVFIDNLSHKEDKTIYETLSKVNEIPLSVRANYLMKSYNFFQTHLSHVINEELNECKSIISGLVLQTRDIMEHLCPTFMMKLIHEQAVKNEVGNGKKYNKSITQFEDTISVISAYLLCTTDEKTQLRRYKDLELEIPTSLKAFNDPEISDDKDKVKSTFKTFLYCLSNDIQHVVIQKKLLIPVKLFEEIQAEIEGTVKISKNYLMMTTWKLTVEFTKILTTIKIGKDWNDICSQALPKFINLCIRHLKADVNEHFPCIYLLFAKALQEAISHLDLDSIKWDIYSGLASDPSFVHGYLAAIKLFPQYYDESDVKAQALRNKIIGNDSVEVKIHYYNRFSENSYNDYYT